MRNSCNIAFLLSICFIILYPVTGQSQTDRNKQCKGIAIYIDYPDVPATINAEKLDLLLNGMNHHEEGAERSFRKYWYEQSRRNIDFTHDIFYYTAPENSTYYESLGWQEGILLWKDALEWIIENYPDYDWRALSIADDDFHLGKKGGILSVKVISSKWGPAGVGASHGPSWTLSNGIKINKIEGATIRAPWDTTPVNIFMSLHESGHNIFGFPDTYDTDGGAAHSGGTGFYSLMSGGKPDVEPIGAPFLADYNWGYVVEPEQGTTTITLRADGDSVVVYRNPYDPEEYFSIEARKKTSIGNSLFPVDLGLLVWHTDTKVSTSNRLSDMTRLEHYRNSIEQADGLFQLEQQGNNRGNAGDIYVPGKTFTNTTTPNSKWWDGNPSNFEISSIEFVGDDHVKFDVKIPATPDRFEEIQQTGWSLVSATPSQYGYSATKAFDGDESTYYHVPWGNSYSRPHEFIIDLGQLYTINEFYYLANTNLEPPWEGRIADYKLYLSEDGFEWNSPVASGRFFYTGINQYVLFENTTGRYMKLEAINSWLGNGSLDDVRTSIAEIKLRGTTDLTSSNRTSNEPMISLYPNPSGDIVNIETTSDHKIQVLISNINGKAVKSISINGSEQLDVSDLSPGMYLVKLQMPSKTVFKKMLKL